MPTPHFAGRYDKFVTGKSDFKKNNWFFNFEVGFWGISCYCFIDFRLVYQYSSRQIIEKKRGEKNGLE